MGRPLLQIMVRLVIERFRWSVAACLLLTSTPAMAVRIRVRANTRITRTEVTLVGEWLEVRGTLQEDAGRPIQKVKLQLDLPGHTTKVAACEGAATPVPMEHPHALTTGLLGDFCLRLPIEVSDEQLVVSYSGDSLHFSSETRLRLTPRRGRVNLSFEASNIDLRLDAKQSLIRVTSALEGTADLARKIPLSLSIVEADQARQIGEAQAIEIGQPAIFVVPTEELGQPGPAILRVAFDGDDQFGASEASVAARKMIPVNLALINPNDSTASGSQWSLSINASTAFGPVPSGAVEARLGGNSLSARELHAGTAVVTLDFASLPRSSTTLALLYLPSEPWWLPSEPLVVTLPPRPEPTPWTMIPWVIGVASIAFWILQAWRRPRQARVADIVAKGRGIPEVRTLDEDPNATGWRGTVIDAHDGEPVAGANIMIQAPAFVVASDGSEDRFRTISNEQGAFALESVNTKGMDGAKLVASASTHRTLSQRLPKAGTIVISLVSRRRALISELVSWSKRLGTAGVRANVDPTPGQIARAATRSEKPQIAEWAREVEHAAFGAEVLDESVEHVVVTKKPTPSKPSE